MRYTKCRREERTGRMCKKIKLKKERRQQQEEAAATTSVLHTKVSACRCVWVSVRVCKMAGRKSKADKSNKTKEETDKRQQHVAAAAKLRAAKTEKQQRRKAQKGEEEEEGGGKKATG